MSDFEAHESTDELVEKLRSSAGMPPPELLEEILARGADAVPGLRRIVEAAPSRPGPDWPLEAAVGLLGETGATGSADVLIALCERADGEIVETIGDALRKVYRGDPAPLIALLRNEKIGWFQRCVALDGLDGLVKREPGRRTAIEDALAGFVGDCTRRASKLTIDDRRVASMCMFTLAERRCHGHRGVVEAAFKAGVKSDMITERDVQESFSRASEESHNPTESYITRYREIYSPDEPVHVPSDGQAPMTSNSGDARSRFDETPPGVQAPARAEKTGRNDPCPCGSGKKYKKCCAK